MTTYADLLAQTAAHLREGASTLAADRFWTPHAALDAIGDYEGLLDAIATHARRLLWPAQLGRIGLARHREGLPQVERAAIALVGAIETITGDSRPHPSQVSASRTPWARAALTLRAAADLVATHYGAGGRPRSPDAVRAETPDFDAGLVNLGHMTRAVLAQEEPLALRAMQAGVPSGVVRRHLPGLEHLADVARELSKDSPESSTARLDALGLVPIRPRLNDAAGELTDRMVRLRQATWELTGDRSDALASLRTMAGLGAAVHAHAAAFHGVHLTAAAPAELHRADALVRRARVWQSLHHALSQFAVLAPPVASIRDDATAVSRQLRILAPLDGQHPDTSGVSDARRTGAALHGAVQVMADIAVHEGATFDRLGRAGLLQVRARGLSRELVSVDPELAAARLDDRTVHAPDRHREMVRQLYAAVAQHPILWGTLARPVHAAEPALLHHDGSSPTL